MNADDVKSILNQQLTGCDIKVEVDGSHVNIIVIGDIFEGKRAVQRQQIVYAVLQELLRKREELESQFVMLHVE